MNPSLPDIGVTITPDGHLEVTEGDMTAEELEGHKI